MSIKPRPKIQLLKGPYAITRLIYSGTLAVAVILFVLLLVSYFALQNTYTLPRVLWSLAALIYIGAIFIPIKYKLFKTASWMLIGLYAIIATLILVFWGVSTPIGVLLMGFSIVLAGVMLGARFIIPVTIGAILLMTIAQMSNSLGIVTPDRSSFIVPGNFGDVAAYSAVLAVFALLSWLSRRQLEQALQKALSAERALKREKSLLAVRLERQTRRLREAQLQEMRQLYHFAELGQLSTSILHELANHLSVLNMDIDDLDQKHRGSKAIKRAKSSIQDLEAMISKVRLQVHSTNTSEKIDLITAVPEILDSLSDKTTQSGVFIRYSTTDKKTFLISGDTLRLSQIMTVLVTNSIDAYEGTDKRIVRPAIDVGLKLEPKAAVIYVRDYGSGISPRKRTQLFLPQRSKKKHGMGIGLFIAKEMVETHFNGSINIDPSYQYTQFNVTIPKQSKKTQDEKSKHRISKGSVKTTGNTS